MPVHAESHDDVVLLRRAALGDRQAFDDLMHRNQAAVYRFIGTLASDQAALEDALQETFLAAWRGAAGFRAEASVRSWLFTIARHTVQRQFRRRAGEPLPEDCSPIDELGVAAGWGATDDPESAAIRKEGRAAIARALESLEPDDRRVLVLRDLEELTGEEAAAVLGLTLPALKSRLHRARLRFAARVRQEGNDGI